MFLSGRCAHIMLDIHRKYGDIVRVAPNELSFSSSQSFQDIYGHASKGRGRFLKTEFYDSGPPRISSARDPEVHARQRKALSHAFSAKALRDQEVVVHEYVDLFLKQLSKLGEAGRKAIDASEAYNWLTFDIIGMSSNPS
jgi:cytochrome P450